MLPIWLLVASVWEQVRSGRFDADLSAVGPRSTSPSHSLERLHGTSWRPLDVPAQPLTSTLIIRHITHSPKIFLILLSCHPPNSCFSRWYSPLSSSSSPFQKWTKTNAVISEPRLRGRPSLHIVLAAYFAILHGHGAPSSSRASFCRKPHCAALQELSTPWSAVALPSPALSVRVCLDPAGSRCYRPSNLGTARGKTAFHGRSFCTAVCGARSPPDYFTQSDWTSCHIMHRRRDLLRRQVRCVRSRCAATTHVWLYNNLDFLQHLKLSKMCGRYWARKYLYIIGQFFNNKIPPRFLLVQHQLMLLSGLWISEGGSSHVRADC